MSTDSQADPERGVFSWMARNPIAANVLMMLLLGGGAMAISGIKKEVFPEFELDFAVAQVTYPGASPAEVESGVILPIEQALDGIQGIKHISSVATESNAVVTIEFLLGENRDTVFSDIKAAIDRIPRSTLPENIESPVVSLASMSSRVLTLVLRKPSQNTRECIHAPSPESCLDEQADRHAIELQTYAEQIREELLQKSNITQIQLSGDRDYEISIEIDPYVLRAHGLTLQSIAQRIRTASIEVPAGEIKSRTGAILLRTTERKRTRQDYENVVIKTQPNTPPLRLGDLATIKDGLVANDLRARYKGEPALLLQIYRSGDQTPIGISNTVKNYIEETAHRSVNNGITVELLNDRSDIYRSRVDLLMRNGWVGLILVLLVLGSFLEPRLAFWVTMGIPISFIGAFLVLPQFGVSLNMISLFAFIMTLGIVVDDAIVVGESAYEYQQRGFKGLKAAILGVQSIGTPVIFSVLTTIFAFSPLLFLPGMTGKFFKNIPLVAIAVLALSLIESLLILPAHLGHTGKIESRLWQRIGAYVQPWRHRVSNALQHFVLHRYQPFLKQAIHHRYITGLVFISAMSLSFAMCSTGVVPKTRFPSIERDEIAMNLAMPFGTSIEETRRWASHIEAAAQQTQAQFQKSGQGEPMDGVYALIGGSESRRARSSGSHLALVRAYLKPSAERTISTQAFVKAWRKQIGTIPGAESVGFSFKTGPAGDSDIAFELTHRDPIVLADSAQRLAAHIATYGQVREINDGYEEGKLQRDFKITPLGLEAGLTETDVATQLRAAYFGVEADRQQRGRHEVRTYVRYPKTYRHTEASLYDFYVRAPNGQQFPLEHIATVQEGRSFTRIEREEGRRILTVSAQLDDPTQADSIRQSMTPFIAQLRAQTPGLFIQEDSSGQDWAATQRALYTGAIGAIGAMLALMMIALKSYFQPLIILLAIPFGLSGAIFGHWLIGFIIPDISLSMISYMGMVALSGIVVNDSLVLVDALNKFRAQGMDLQTAIISAGVRRFRPILLTTLTTFFGLMPMLLEQSIQARFLIPMAISLAFGVLLATVVTLVLVPAVYQIGDDLHRWIGQWTGFEDEKLALDNLA